MNLYDVQLETGSERGWETKDAAEELKSVAESHVFAYSLQRSREKWLNSVFPRFTSKSKKGSKAGSDTSAVLPHDLRFRGICEVQIGPHIFSNTSFQEAVYLTPATDQTSSIPSYVGLTSNAASHSTFEPTAASPALIDQINAAAATNPVLASLLQLASTGQATQDQLQMLSVTIRSLAANPIPPSHYGQSNVAPVATSTSPASKKDTDLVVTFAESSQIRFVIPRGIAVCEPVSGTGNDLEFNVVLYVQLHKKENGNTPAGHSQNSSYDKSHMLRMTLRGASESLWNTINHWIGGEDIIKANREILDGLKAKRPRKTYLAYRLPEGSVLDRVSAASSAPYPMKFLKPPASIPRPRRSKKTILSNVSQASSTSYLPSSETQTTTQSRRKRNTAELTENYNAALDLAAAITGAGQTGSSASNEPAHSSTISTPKSVVLTVVPPPPSKKQKPRTSRKTANDFQPAATEIKCRSCQATNVPLMLGGRFCRTCVEAGRGTADIPQVPGHGSRASASYTPKYIPPPAPPPIGTHTHLTLMNASQYPSATPRSDAVADITAGDTPNCLNVEHTRK
ncbi:hypothetical protein FB446DRAFT_789115 [Lentinula raphanica]|nr:hypothetical protein FB446DRAFT_789115 [Lentinula raphanica]